MICLDLDQARDLIGQLGPALRWCLEERSRQTADDEGYQASLILIEDAQSAGRSREAGARIRMHQAHYSGQIRPELAYRQALEAEQRGWTANSLGHLDLARANATQWPTAWRRHRTRDLERLERRLVRP